MRDPDEDSIRLLGVAKASNGRGDVPTLRYAIESAHVADTDEGAVWTGRLTWQGESTRSVQDALEATSEPTDRTATMEAATWLGDWLAMQPDQQVESKAVKAAARQAGHADRTIKRVLKMLSIVVTSAGYPRRTYWALPSPAGPPAGPTAPSTHIPGPTGPTGPTGAKTDNSEAKSINQAKCCAFPRAREEDSGAVPLPPGSQEAADRVAARLAAGELARRRL
jgi:hypothetical protein